MTILSKQFDTVEEGMKELKRGVTLRNQMGGALYWNIVNDDCIKLADKLVSMGADYDEVDKIMRS